MLPPQRKARWLANMQAAGVEPDETTVERVEGGLAERVTSLNDLFERLNAYSSNPDYLRSRTEMEAGNGRS